MCVQLFSAVKNKKQSEAEEKHLRLIQRIGTNATAVKQLGDQIGEQHMNFRDRLKSACKVSPQRFQP